ncbi:hypothetical protein QV06_00645 [Gallibacterium genomosp. 3]|uniref:Uncharacterized protein n=1 Tax=Gallibacterium genomosp. 3 TaxID=505345 RepID=A0A1A7PW45_9PAST|nr:hypothetical protein [Gallibacterium genomosp. 3]OBX05942.1 hypothetical protein QV06_00645 [Gallibacterium genomosp. 3]
MFSILLIFFWILIVIFCVVFVPLGLLFGIVLGTKDQYEFAITRKEKVQALLTPLMLASPFIYYNFINDSLWQAALSLLFIPIVTEAIFTNAKR